MDNIKYDDFHKEAMNLKKYIKDYKRTGKPFVDPNFHPTKTIFERDSEIQFQNVIWKRVDELYNVPLFKKELINKDFVQQGNIGDCYFIAALSRIAIKPYLIPLLFETTTFNQLLGLHEDTIDLKCGAVVVYFYCFGRRTPVLIDTLLPTRYNRLIYSHPPDNTKSPWFCLVEKAFAKLSGSYSDIVGGSISISFYNLFGYYPSHKKFVNLMTPEKVSKIPLFDRIMRYQYFGAAMGVAIHVSDPLLLNEIKSKGLVDKHCYLIVKVREHNGKHFFCLRNPWGNFEWNGDYCDNSHLWTPELKQALDWKLCDDGTFWMIEKDFFKYFTDIKMSRPVLPQWHKRNFFIQLTPGDHDGYNPSFSQSKVDRRPNYVFQLIEPVEAGKKCHFRVIVERIEKLYDTRTKTLYETPDVGIFFTRNNGRKINSSEIWKYPHSAQSSGYNVSTFKYEIDGRNNLVTMFIFRQTKCNLIEDCYVSVICEYDFKLYNVDTPDNLIDEEDNTGIAIDNFSINHPNAALPMKIVYANGRRAVGLGSISSSDYDPDRDKKLGNELIRLNRKNNILYPYIEIEKLVNENKALEDENKKLKDLLEKEKLYKESALKKLKSKNDEINNLKNDNDKLQNQIRTIQNEIASSKKKDEEIDKLKTSLSKAQKKCDSINEENNKIRALYYKTQKECLSKNEEINALKSDNNNLQNQLRKFQNEIASFKNKDEEIDKLKTSLSKSQENCDSLNEENNKIRAIFAEAQKECASKNEEINALKRDNNKLQNQLRKIQNDIASFKKKDEEIDKLKTSLSKAQKKCDSINEENNKIRAIFAKAQKECASKNEEINSLKEEINRLTRIIQNMNQNHTANYNQFRSDSDTEDYTTMFRNAHLEFTNNRNEIDQIPDDASRIADEEQ